MKIHLVFHNVLAVVCYYIMFIYLSSSSSSVHAFTPSSLSLFHHPTSNHHPTIADTTATTTATRTVTTTYTHKYNKESYHPYDTSTILYSSTSPMNNNNDDGDDDKNGEQNEEGKSLAADFFKTLQSRNIQLDENDLLDEDDDDEEEDEEEDMNENNVVSDNQVYNELNERVLETAGGFVDLVTGATDDDDDEDDEDDEEEEKKKTPKVYQPPKTFPDPALTAGEVVMTVLEALNNNDNPTPDYGIQILFAYSSQGSAISQAIEIEGMTPAEYAMFLKEEYEYKVLFNHGEVMIEKGDYSFDRKKAFFTARLSEKVEENVDGGASKATTGFTNVNFILSTDGQDEEDCWLIDSLLIRPPDMRRRRRR